jgi:hypothetical protein
MTTPQMTRAHFELIARILKEAWADFPTIERFACELSATNPRFNAKRFIAACQGDWRNRAATSRSR